MPLAVRPLGCMVALRVRDGGGSTEMKGVFDTKADSGYDDAIVERYHFPARYLIEARAMVGDWIVYREPFRNGGRKAYIAVARVMRIAADTSRSGHFYAEMADFLPFDRLVPFRGPHGYWEQPLRSLPDQSKAGMTLQGRSVRRLDDHDFMAIVHAGLNQTLAPSNALRLELDLPHLDAVTAHLLNAGVQETAATWEEQERRTEQILLNRKIRDANFRLNVCEAYDNRCAVTGLRLINGGGKAEVQAAHIWPVKDGGPDIVQNGLALSGTIHWLFDRHLISLTDEYRLLVSHNKVPAELRGLFANQMNQIHLPKDKRLWPHVPYVARHREAFSAAA
jgi:putative restriction endonuclease